MKIHTSREIEALAKIARRLERRKSAKRGVACQIRNPLEVALRLAGQQEDKLARRAKAKKAFSKILKREVFYLLEISS